MTAAANKLLAETLRGTASAPALGLRARLLSALHDEAEARYRLSVPLARAGLDPARQQQRVRLEQATRPGTATRTGDEAATPEAALARAVLQVAATFVYRVVLLRHLEALGLASPPVLTGGLRSAGYLTSRERAEASPDDPSAGYATLLQRRFDALAVELPGLFADDELARLLVVPAAALREVVVRLDAPELATAWPDDTTLGWVYQYWTEPERRAIDAHLDGQSKLRSGDIGAKTQVFTERYMVEWLLQNSLGRTWLGMCARRGIRPDAERVLPALEARRTQWRRDPHALPPAPPPLEDELADRWRYYLPEPLPDAAVARAPRSLQELRLLDPACGTGHFLVVAFDLLAALYREEARHLGAPITERAIAESILEHNLHGVDIEPRVVQLAAATLYVKAKELASDAQPARIQLVALDLDLGTDDDGPATQALRQDLQRLEIPEHATTTLVADLAGARHLGSLLKLEVAVGALLAARANTRPGGQAPAATEPDHATCRERVAGFLEQRSRTDDLGVRLGDPLSAGARFSRVTQAGTFDLIVGNPPYFGTQSLADTRYLDRAYPLSRENLCTAMLERATELARDGGQIAMVTVRNWLYVSQLSALRAHLFTSAPPRCAADLGLGGFDALPGVEVVMLVAERGASAGAGCCVVDARGAGPAEKAAALLHAWPIFHTEIARLAKLPGSPFVYRWSEAAIDDYLSRPRLGDVAPVRVGMKTSDNLRFLRRPWELCAAEARGAVGPDRGEPKRWVPYVKGAAGKVWLEPLADLVRWHDGGLEVRIALDAAYGQGPQGERHFWKRGVAFSTIGRSFVARAHRYPSLFDVAGSSAFPDDVAATVCLLNSAFAREVVEDLNPTINFQVGDVARVPYRVDPRAAQVLRELEAAFAVHEAADERSVAFRAPGPSPWASAQRWAQQVVDTPPSDPVPDGHAAYAEALEQPTAEARLSFALGVALGRFGAPGSAHEGWCDEPPAGALPAGLLFLSAAAPGVMDSLEHPACAALRAAWEQHGAALGEGADLGTYLRRSFFETHRRRYEGRPIYLPLSSARRSFVAYAAIHRWTDGTLDTLLASHLLPTRRWLAAEAPRDAPRARLLEELDELIEQVTELAERGPPPAGVGAAAREVDARFALDLADGVLVNSAALWPLLEPQWKEPRRWWAQLASRSGPKGTHFDWSRVAARYFPHRVRAECARSAVLASAHGCLWLDHPQAAYAWELRLQHRLGAGFTLAEPDAEACRGRFLREHPATASEVLASEQRRRGRTPRAAGDARRRGRADT